MVKRTTLAATALVATVSIGRAAHAQEIAPVVIVAPPAEGQPAQTYAPPPEPAEPRLPRGSLNLAIGVQTFSASSYTAAGAPWGYYGFGSGGVFALEGGAYANRYLFVGARIGYTTASGGSSNYDGASLSLQTVDFDLMLRVGAPIALGHHWFFFPGAQFEAGGMDASLSLRSDSTSAFLGRLDGAAVAMFGSEHVGIGLRIGYQWAEWDNVENSGLTLSLAGAYVALGLEVLL